ncbi:MAG: hypothetical protein HKN04_10275 [Rhodothermaceae bacterium]|nr:hypothetical protein [Rhodothermaceae bacterium]
MSRLLSVLLLLGVLSLPLAACGTTEACDAESPTLECLCDISPESCGEGGASAAPEEAPESAEETR